MEKFRFGEWQVLCAPECGGNLLQVYHNGITVLRGTSEIRDWQKTPTNYGLPTLFPPNRIGDGWFDWRGKRCFLPQNDIPWPPNHIHGIALRTAWHLDNVTENSLEMSFVYDAEAPEYQGFPFDCTLTLRYEFSKGQLRQIFRVSNDSAVPMPAAAGFHTTFPMPETLDISAGKELFEIPPPKHLPSGKMIPWEDGFAPRMPFVPAEVEKYGFFPATEQPKAVLKYRDFSIVYLPDPQFAYWMMWRPKNDNSFLCIEPMNIVVNALKDAPETVPTILPGDTKEMISCIRVEE